MKIRARLHISVEWRDCILLPGGFVATIEHVQTTREAWLKSARSRSKSWRWRSNGFLVTAYRIDW